MKSLTDKLNKVIAIIQNKKTLSSLSEEEVKIIEKGLQKKQEKASENKVEKTVEVEKNKLDNNQNKTLKSIYGITRAYLDITSDYADSIVTDLHTIEKEIDALSKQHK